MSKQAIQQNTASRGRVPQSAHFYVSETDVEMELLETDGLKRKSISMWAYFKMMMLGFEFNLEKWLGEQDPEVMAIVEDLLKVAPGYKSTQRVFTYYLLTSNLAMAFCMALLYPLPYTILFAYLGLCLEDLQAQPNWGYSVVILVLFTGMRSGVIALLAKYAIHLPQGRFYWVVLLATLIVGTAFRSNYIFVLLYGISIFLSFYVKEDGRQSRLSSRPSEEERLLASYRQVTPFKKTYPVVCGGLIVGMVLGVWLYSRFQQSEAYIYTVYEQFIFIALLNHSRVALAFYPLLFAQVYTEVSLIKAADVMGLNLLIPGSHLKPFFTLIGSDLSIKTFLFSYICLYLPSILILCVYLAYRRNFYTVLWDNSLRAMQAVANGLVFSIIIYILSKEDCNFNAVTYSAIVIFCVIKLYHLREMFAALLGVMLIISRSGVLYLNKNVPFEDFACMNKSFEQTLENL